jgi:hypothetical protein
MTKQGKHVPPPKPAAAKEDKQKRDADRRLDEELAESFPASDPPSILRDGTKPDRSRG